MITDQIMLTVEYIEKNLGVETIGAIVILSLIIAAIFSVLSLAFRGVRLWYWRVNCQVTALENINTKLEELNQAIPKVNAQSDLRGEDSEEVEAIGVDIKAEPDTNIIETQRNHDTLEEGRQEQILPCDDIKKGYKGYNVGKSGKIYNEEELRQQMQF